MKNFYEFNEHLQKRFLKEVSFNWDKEGASDYIEELRDDLKDKIFSLTEGDSVYTLREIYKHLPTFISFFSFKIKVLDILKNHLKTLMDLRDEAVELAYQGMSLPANVDLLNDLNDKLGSIALLFIQLDNEASDVLDAMDMIISAIQKSDLNSLDNPSKKSLKESVEHLINYLVTAKPIEKIKKNIYGLQSIMKFNQRRN